MEQRSPEWYQARIGKITASCFADVLAKPETATHKNYMLQVATERVTGIAQGSDYINDAMQWGIDHEAAALLAYEAYSGSILEPCGLILHPELPHVGGSPDSLVGASGLLECKCPKSTTHYEYLLAEKLPAKYRPQVQGQIWVTGREWADFISYDPRFPPHVRLLVVRVERDDKYIAELAERVAEFESGVQAMMRRIEPVQLREAA